MADVSYAQLRVATNGGAVIWEADLLSPANQAPMASPAALGEHVGPAVAFQAGRGGGIMILPLAR